MVDRKKQIKKWKKNHPGKTECDEISKDLRSKVRELKGKGATKITDISKETLENFGKGVLISYITKNDKYRSGGFLTVIEDDYFVLLGGGGYGPRISFSVQYDTVKLAFVRKIIREKAKPIKPVKTSKKVTLHPVLVDNIPVFYGRDSYDADRFRRTKKYKLMQQYMKIKAERALKKLNKKSAKKIDKN